MQVQERLNLDLEHGVNISVDLNKIKMSEEQRAILKKLISKIDSLDTAECTKEGCPAQKHLSSEEFEKIRKLSATLAPLTPDLRAAGPIVDFCLHVVNVHQAV
jgi:hypothetical protein